jgi:predicted transposase/invertase (TIGR01784 family)
VEEENTLNDKDKSKIHDKFTREIFDNIALAREFLERHLPEDIKQRVDLNYLKALPTSMIVRALGGSESIADLLFETKLSGHKALLYFLLEHKSYPDKFTPLQTHVYQACAWYLYHKNNPGKKLPLIFTIVLHHGKSPYKHSTDLRDLIDAPRELIDRYMLKPFHLLDLCQVSDEQITGSPELQLAELILKHVFDANLFDYLKKNIPSLLKKASKNNADLVLAVLEYLIRTGNIDVPQQEYVDFIAKTIDNEIPDIAEKIMNLGDRLIQQGKLEGRLEGKIEGKLEGKLEAARSMLRHKMEPSVVAEITGLDLQEILAEAKKLLEEDALH